MSAYVVHPRTVAVICAAWVKLDRNPVRNVNLRLGGAPVRPNGSRVYAGKPCTGVEVLWMALTGENEQSVARLYREPAGVPAPFDAALVERSAALLVGEWIGLVAKAIDCLEYQACEHPEWGTSEAREALGGLRKALLKVTPGYEAGVWGADWGRGD